MPTYSTAVWAHASASRPISDEDLGGGYAAADESARLRQTVQQLQGELVAERAKAKEIILALKREVESVLQESETSASEAREQGAQLLAAAEGECARQRENVEWLQSALERAEDRAHALETAALSSSQSESQVAERTAAAVAKARAPLELRAEGLATQVRTLTAELETERRRYSELQRKASAVPRMEQALLALQAELAEETSRSIGMEERLTHALQADQAAAAAAVEGERAQLRAARRALEAERDRAVAAYRREADAQVSAAQKERDGALEALDAEQQRSAAVKERLKAEVVAVMAQRESTLVQHQAQLQSALDDANAEGARARKSAEEAARRVRQLEEERAGARSSQGADARCQQLGAELASEKAYVRELERQVGAAAGGGGATTPLGDASDEPARLRADAAAARALAARLQDELDVQALVVQRGDALVSAKHALSGEVQRLRAALEAEQTRSRDTELALLAEVEALTRDLPQQMRASPGSWS